MDREHSQPWLGRRSNSDDEAWNAETLRGRPWGTPGASSGSTGAADQYRDAYDHAMRDLQAQGSMSHASRNRADEHVVQPAGQQPGTTSGSEERSVPAPATAGAWKPRGGRREVPDFEALARRKAIKFYGTEEDGYGRRWPRWPGGR